jgi:hypothetical protein
VISQGNWGALEQRELLTLPKLPLRTRALKVAREILIGILPLSIFLVARQIYTRMDPQLEASALSLVLGWTGISLLALLDPRYAEKLSSFKDLGDIFASGKKENAASHEGTGQSLSK